ncbi:MAG: TFIIB-type zinc ribbon-containing protein [Planctomycetota bacterium]|jgi:Zn-finger nucleic acid-binding protein
MSDTDTDILACPKCEDANLEPVTASGVTVHRCHECAGIWLDEGQRIKLMQHKDAVKQIDTGSHEIGHEHNAVTGGTCPRCNAELHHVHDKAQKQIGFEVCRNCKGSFFDAGELTDLTVFTLSERIRALLSRD